jgi:hypothetical protein
MILSEAEPEPARPPVLQVLPNLIIPGAQKSGTSSLCLFLKAHPECAVSEPKEPNYFSRARNLDAPERSQACFRHGTTTYMADPAIAPRIKSVLKDGTKIIFTLRAPVARSYAGYLHMLKRGHERRSPEEVFLNLPAAPQEAAAAESAAIKDAAHHRKLVVRPYRTQYDDMLWNFRYVGNSLYSGKVEQYARIFGRDNVLVLVMGEMIADPAGTAQTLGSFLGVDPAGFPSAFKRTNATRLPDTSSPSAMALEQFRRLRQGNFTFVRRTDGSAPLKPLPAIQEKLSELFAGERDYWSGYFGRDLRQIGW